ncbi:MAG: family 1 glycosylhydrolase [Polyangiaceae bacterium]
MSPESAAPALPLWGGIECTVNRVGDAHFDQVVKTGHEGRAEDVARLADLGITALRYPVLWERAARGPTPRDLDFSWADARLALLRERGVRPIVGLVHHGSGPLHTSLVDPELPQKLAEYARAVAERYPWIEDFTPINEPLTTARFSGLYGHWYPHGRSARSFVRALLGQCHATARAMEAIREVTPGARLVQTEDFGRTYSTPSLAYQARHENLRRLLSIDLLCGRVDRRHPLFGYLLSQGAHERELHALVERPCPPDILGVNYYVTSDRFLDERLERYPAWSHGGNGRHAYADVEAVRVRGEGLTGHLAVLLELHERYRLPLAITEAHLGGAREDQLRWFLEAFRGAKEARERGADVRAVTAWSLLGAFDWDSLVILDRGHYEPGAFDVRCDPPRPTAVARMVQSLAREGQFKHPVTAASLGWWRRPVRLLYPAVSAPVRDFVSARDDADRPQIEAVPAHRSSEDGARPILVAGAGGRVGRAFARICAHRGLSCKLVCRREMDIADRAAVEQALIRYQPWAVVNAAGYARIDEAERDPMKCARENVRGASALAAACADIDVPLVTFSSDLVFGGHQRTPYVEDDDVAPLGVYGQSKAEAEREVMRLHPRSLIVRTAALFCPWEENGDTTGLLKALLEGRPVRAAEDSVVSPTYLPDLVHATLDLLVDAEQGLFHLANRGAVSYFELARRIASLSGIDPKVVVPCPGRALGMVAPRPAYSVLGSRRGVLLPPLEESLSRYVLERSAPRVREAAA